MRGRVPTAGGRARAAAGRRRRLRAARRSTSSQIVGEGAGGTLQANIDDAVDGRTIAFETGSAAITKAGQKVLLALVKPLKAAGSSAVVVGGYTDNVGDAKANLKLSQARAHSVVVWLDEARRREVASGREGLRRDQADRDQHDRGRPQQEPAHRIHRAERIEGALMLETAGEIVIWMVLAALVGFATGWALRSVVANRARARLSERLEEKRREAQELREELRHLRGDDEDVVHVPGAGGPGARVGGRRRAGGAFAEPSLSATAEHDEVAHDAEHDRSSSARSTSPSAEAEADEEIGGSTRAMRLDEVEWEDVEEPPRKRDDEA